jgi:hypothetical protein
MDDPSIFIEPSGGACLQTIAGHRNRVSALQLVNSEVWSGSSDGTILIHDAAVSVCHVCVCMCMMCTDLHASRESTC